MLSVCYSLIYSLLAGIAVSCLPLGGPSSSSRNIKYWDEALTAARKHHDIYLEGLTTKNMGIVPLLNYGYAHCSNKAQSVFHTIPLKDDQPAPSKKMYRMTRDEVQECERQVKNRYRVYCKVSRSPSVYNSNGLAVGLQYCLNFCKNMSLQFVHNHRYRL